MNVQCMIFSQDKGQFPIQNIPVVSSHINLMFLCYYYYYLILRHFLNQNQYRPVYCACVHSVQSAES